MNRYDELTILAYDFEQARELLALCQDRVLRVRFGDARIEDVRASLEMICSDLERHEKTVRAVKEEMSG